jgi:uncharacterized protein
LKIGIISDTHDDIESVIRAINVFNNEKVDLVIHAGDYIFPGIVQQFTDLEGAKLIGVFGNNDGEKIGLYEKFSKIGADLKGEFCEIKIDGLIFGIYHGTSKDLTEAAIDSGKYDVFICGHTHIKRGEKKGRTIVLNPGTAHRNFPNINGEVENVPQIIIFDTDLKSYTFLPIFDS